MAEDNVFGGYDRRFTRTQDVLANDGKKVSDPTLVGSGKGIVDWKTIEFWFGGADGKTPYDNRSNWRKIDLGGINFSKNPVNDYVVLIPEQTEFKVSSEVKWEDEETGTTKGGGLLDLLQSAAEIFAGSVMRPEWSARSFSDLNALGLGNEYTFKFAYGKFGLFNAFEEVVKPILALTLFFGVEARRYKGEQLVDDWNGHLLESAASNINNPGPTHAQFLAERVLGALGTLRGTSLSDLSGNTLAKANALIQSALASGAHNVSTSSAYRNCYMSWGRFMFGPFQYDKIEYMFDQKNMDSNGWPTMGQFTISGIKSMRRSTTQALISPLVRGV
jgi:hypothetical protein